VFDADPVALLAREVLREGTAALVAETCAWSVGLSDAPHHVRRSGRIVPTGLTLGVRAEAGQPLGSEEDARLETADAVPGSFADALNALTASGGLQVDRYEHDVLLPFVLETCRQAALRAAQSDPQGWVELLDELGEDGSDLSAVVRAAEWDAALRADAELLVLAALGDAPLVEVEAEGLPLSLVRAAEAELRRAAGSDEQARPSAPPEDEVAGALFLADVALRTADVALPVVRADARPALRALLAEGLEPEEVLAVLPHLPVLGDAAEEIATELASRRDGTA
jgi:hypothetical protein